MDWLFDRSFDSYMGIVLGTVVVLFGVILGVAAGFDWYSSCRQAQVINAQNGSHWTCGDIYWAGSQINAQTQTIKLKQ